ncbi:MAG: Asp23/Gls24 family envelope stress response protein [Clostridia bacterium]|nr:Asp23/Gls24 family envelope stress response protein [Clostridia bacterium]
MPNKTIDNEKNGKVIYNAGIVKGIVALAVSDVNGVSLRKIGKKDNLDLIKISFTNEDIDVDVSVDIEYGYNVPDVAYEIQQSVKRNVESMSKYKVNTVDVHFEGVSFPNEFID